MNKGSSVSLNSVLQMLRILDNGSVSENYTSTNFLETVKRRHDDGVIINGNTDGLVRLARLVLEVAAKDIAGAHQHFDDVGELDTCEVPLTIVLKPAEWDV
jgi:hypothetical protein